MQINSNISGMQNNNSLRLHSLDFNTRIERLSSGLRINKGADDPSGLAISKGMTAQIRGAHVASQNIQDAISLIQTADTGAAEIHDILMRMKGLAVRAANEATLSSSDWQRFNNEFQSAKDEIDQIAQNTTYNTKQILTGGGNGDSIRLLYVSGPLGAINIYSINLDGTDPVNLTNNPSLNHGAKVSPDGKKIYFLSDRSGDQEIYSMDTTGSNVLNLTNSPGIDTGHLISPDGSKIAFRTYRDGNAEVYIMNNDGTGLLNITNDLGADNVFDWSPDGEKLVIMSNRTGNYELYTINKDGTGLQQLTNDLANDTQGRWSPDGSQIYFMSNRTGSNQLYSINSDGTGLLQLTNSAGNNFWTYFSSDGSKVFFLSTRDGNNELYSMDPDGANQVNLTQNPANDQYNGYSTFFVDENTIGFTSNRDGNNEVYIMDLDGGNQRRITNNPTYDTFLGVIPSSPSEHRVQVGADANAVFEIVFPNLTEFGLGVSNLSLTSTGLAQLSITMVGNAINIVSDVRSELGIQQRRLGHILDETQQYSINLAAARSRIEDADMAVEATEFVKRQILTQSTSAMSAQANSEQSAVLDLISQSV